MSASRRRPQRALRRQLGLEQLDTRICLAVDAFLVDTTLNVNGSGDADIILVTDDGRGAIHVQDGRTGQRHQFSGVEQVVVDAQAGDDIIRFVRSGGVSPLPALDIDAGGDDDDVYISLLLPVQKVRATLTEASAQMTINLADGNNRLLVSSTGFSDVDLDLTAGGGDDNVLIGLLLPAVQKVRDAAARASVSVDVGDGNDYVKVGTNGLDQLDLDIAAGGGDDNVLIGLLLPAVQKVRDAAARATIDLGDGNDRLQINTTGFNDLDLDLSSGIGDDNVLIGLLVPAVQKVRQAGVVIDLGDGNNRLQFNTTGIDQVDLNLTAGTGDDNVLIGLLLPAVQKVRDAAARASLNLGDGNNQLTANTTGIPHVEFDVAAGDGDDNVLIGLLLPAVQKVNNSSASVNLNLGAGNNTSNIRYRGFAIVDRTRAT